MSGVTSAMLDAWGFPTVEAAPALPATFCASKPSVSDLAHVTGRARDIWQAPAVKGERSKRDFLFVLALLKSGADEATACRLLWALPGGKASEDGRGQDYWKATLESVRKRLDEETQLRLKAQQVPVEAREKPGFAFRTESLDALLFLRDDSAELWQNARAELKKAKVPLRELEANMAKRQSDLAPLETVAVRFVKANGTKVGWFFLTDSGWTTIDGSDLRSTLRASGMDADAIIKAETKAAWRIVNEPFQCEELPDRQWNKDAARLAFEPVEGVHPTWDMILHNVARNLDGVVAANDWCQRNGITTGWQYLRAWVASLIQVPNEPLSYLFFHGPQGGGKSLFHEALKLLFTRGYILAKHALTSKSSFNGELANAVLAVVEEIDLSDRDRTAYTRIKEWTTAKTLSVRPLYVQAYDTPNRLHFIQCANPLSHCPALEGDTRITTILVERVDAGEEVPKEVILSRLMAEAPAFLWTVTRLALPAPEGRMRVAALDTNDKTEVMAGSRNELEAWLLEHPEWTSLPDAELVGSFLSTLEPRIAAEWERGRVLRELPAEGRRDRRLVLGLRRLVGRSGRTSDLLAMLGADVRGDYRSPDALGKALARLAKSVPWLTRDADRSEGTVWRVLESKPLAASSAP